MFPPTLVGTVLFPRTKLIGNIMKEIQSQIDTKLKFVSIYFRGPRGFGKSVLLVELAKKYQDRGEKVYFLDNALGLGRLSREYLESLQKDLADDQRIYLFIDEVQDNPRSELWTYLFKTPNKFVVIGAGIPSLNNMSAQFYEKKNPSFIKLTRDDLVDGVIDSFESKSGYDRELVTKVLNYVLEYTNGHMFPFVKLCEYLLITSKPNLNAVHEAINSAEFFQSKVYQNIIRRVEFDNIDMDLLLTAFQSKNRQFVEKLVRVGWWDSNSKSIYSKFLFTYLLNNSEVNDPVEITLNDSVECLENVMCHALSRCSYSDFEEPTGAMKYENAIGVILGCYLHSIGNLYIAPQFQVPPEKPKSGPVPTIDYFLNGRVKKCLELVRNGKEVPAHFNKFEGPGGAYQQYRDRYAILNLELNQTSPTGVPDQDNLKEKYYTFVVQNNALYKGTQILRQNVSPKLRCRLFSTLKSLLRRI